MYVTLEPDEVDNLLYDYNISVESIPSLRKLVEAHESFVAERFSGNISDIDLDDVVNESLHFVRETFADKLNWYAHPYSAHVTRGNKSILFFGTNSLYKALSDAVPLSDCTVTPCPFIWASPSIPLYVIGSNETNGLTGTSVNTIVSVARDRSEMDPWELIDLETSHVQSTKPQGSMLDRRLDLRLPKALPERAQENPQLFVEKTMAIETITHFLSGIKGPTCEPFRPQQYLQSCRATYCNEHVLAKIINGYFPKK